LLIHHYSIFKDHFFCLLCTLSTYHLFALDIQMPIYLLFFMEHKFWRSC